MLAPFFRLYFQLFFKERLAYAASHAVKGGPVARPPGFVLPAVRSAVLPSGATGHPLHQVHPGVLELRPDHPEAQEENPEVISGARRVVGALIFRARAGGGLGLGGDCEAQLNVGLDLTGVIRAIKRADLHRPGSEQVVEVDRPVAAAVVVLRMLPNS